ncbi:MAG: EamA family transporter, partial [Rhizobiaceae bacterium]|nr:EamA family transporter [Rhizobiaceae bacterium]
LFFVVTEASCFFWAVRYLPLADTFMIYLAAPIFVTALSPFMLGEKVGFLRWAAVLTGFGGVVLIFPPSEAALSLPAFVAIAGSLGLAMVMILTRKLREADPVRLITLQTLAMAVAASFTLPVVWITPTGFEFMLFCLLGIVATTAHFLINHAMRASPASVVAPFQYSTIIWAMLLGFFFWNETPTPTSLFGASIVVGSGLFILYRETRQKNV